MTGPRQGNQAQEELSVSESVEVLAMVNANSDHSLIGLQF